MNQKERELFLRSPYVYFGGKSTVADYLWTRFGPADNYVEPFMGSAACLLGRPDWNPGDRLTETVNDVDGFIVNFWRAIKADPEGVAHHADNPMFESDLHARHSWLVARVGNLTQKLEGDPNFFNTRIAGWWAWGLACWIGSGFCSGDGPWVQVEGEDGDMILVNKNKGGELPGDSRKLPAIDTGRGVSRSLIKFGGVQGVKRIIPRIGVNGVMCPEKEALVQWLSYLQSRFAHVRVCCGDWARVCTDSTTIHSGNVTAILLDPPYTKEGRGSDFKSYRNDDLDVAHRVREWCKERGPDPRFRIAFCGYAGEHDELEKVGWEVYSWSGPTGYANQSESEAKAKRDLERIWLSPHCVPEKQKPSLGFFGKK